jgi:hypothetical protein
MNPQPKYHVRQPVAPSLGVGNTRNVRNKDFDNLGLEAENSQVINLPARRIKNIEDSNRSNGLNLG